MLENYFWEFLEFYFPDLLCQIERDHGYSFLAQELERLVPKANRNRVYVVKGYGEMGRRLGLVGEKAYVPAKDCRLVTRNREIVCM